MVDASPKRLLGDLASLVHQPTGVREFSARAARILARVVPFDGVCVVTLDPATRLPTGEVVENALPELARRRIAEIDIGGADFNTFRALACGTPHAASLSEVTEGDLDRSLRYRELKRPGGFGDELRAALTVKSTTWGGISLLRGIDRRNFTAADTSLLASVTPYLAEGLRRAMLFTAISEKRQDHDAPVGLALIAPDNSIMMTDPAGESWLAELREGDSGGSLPVAVNGVVCRARDIAVGLGVEGPIARARVRTASGRWLLLRASTLGDPPDVQTAVIMEPARPHELAPLIAQAYGLTAREQAVTQLVAQGLSTGAIGARLHLSPWTVQDHLKSIFEKVDVGTRGELVARVYFERFVPLLVDGEHEQTISGRPDDPPLLDIGRRSPAAEDPELAR